MPLESGTYISDLNANNPVGASDPKSQGDDHIRLIKSTILNTFPNIDGAVTSDETELNYLDGATGVTGTGNTVRSASPTLTGTLTAAAITASGVITGDGSGLTTLNADELDSGTVPVARLPQGTVSAIGALELATTAEAAAGTDTARAVTAAGVEAWAAQNGGMVQDISNLADPGADRLLGWDDSASAAIGFSVGHGLDFSGTSVIVDDSDIVHDDLSGFVANEHRLITVSTSAPSGGSNGDIWFVREA